MSEFLIGLYGDSRSGKDSVAAFLGQDFGFKQRNMADKIREMLLRLDPLVNNGNYGEEVPLSSVYKDAQGDWDLIKQWSPDSVDWMITLGQSARDIIGETVWLDAVLENRPEKLVIADVRQPNEYLRIAELGGQIWKISRPGTKPRGMDRLLEGYEFDATIENRGTLIDLRGQVQSVLSSHIHGMYVQRNDFLKESEQ